MALGYLFILFVVLIGVSILGITLLYLSKNEKIKNIAFYFLAVWAILLAFLNATSLPTNYFTEKSIAWAVGIVSLIGVIFRLKNPKKTTIPNILVTASIIFGLYTLIF